MYGNCFWYICCVDAAQRCNSRKFRCELRSGGGSADGVADGAGDVGFPAILVNPDSDSELDFSDVYVLDAHAIQQL